MCRDMHLFKKFILSHFHPTKTQLKISKMIKGATLGWKQKHLGFSSDFSKILQNWVTLFLPQYLVLIHATHWRNTHTHSLFEVFLPPTTNPLLYYHMLSLTMKIIYPSSKDQFFSSCKDKVLTFIVFLIMAHLSKWN